ncbi:hypothetical protein AB0J85_17125 [Micromonospora echinofusca]
MRGDSASSALNDVGGARRQHAAALVHPEETAALLSSLVRA